MTKNNDKYRQRNHRGGAIAQQSIAFDFDDAIFDDETTFASAPHTEQPAQPKAATTGSDEQGQQWHFASFGSGSSGNCAFLGNEHEGVLIDAGVNPDQVFPVLERNGVRPHMVKGIILTHDHADHVRYAYKIVRQYKHMRIYCTPKLLRGVLMHHNVSRRIRDYHEQVFKEIPFKLAGMTITAFETSHDAFDNMGFSIEAGDKRFVVGTDMGVITDRAAHYMAQAHYLMIESNYDDTMLTHGTYPEYLKARVRGPQGHLDNVVAAQFVAQHYHEGLKYVFLCHLSNDNNTPQRALDTMTEALKQRGLTVGDGSNSLGQRDRDIQVYALPRFDPSLWFVL